MMIAGIGAAFALFIAAGVGYTLGVIHGYETGVRDSVEYQRRNVSGGDEK